MEVWKDVVGYSGIYDVSGMGRVRSLYRILSDGRKLKGRVLKPSPDGRGYLNVSLSKNGKVKTRKIHQLVCESFIGPRLEGIEVCHGPNGKLDNSLSNLRYGTKSENAQDRVRDGTQTIGQTVICSDGREFMSQHEAARVTSCNQGHISACCKGKRKTAGGYYWKCA